MKALCGKRDRFEVRQFLSSLELNLLRMSAELQAGTLVVGRYHQFVIYDPKERVITAPCFEERILHHAGRLTVTGTRLTTATTTLASGDGSQKGDQGGSQNDHFGSQKGDHLSPFLLV